MNRRKIAFGLLGAALLVSCVAIDTAIKYQLWIKPSLSLHADPLGGMVALQPGDPQPGPAFIDGDAYYWLSYAQDTLSHRTWRIRTTPLDNAPYGRSVHWFSGLSWYLAAGAWLVHHTAGLPLACALECVGLLCGPILAIMILLVLHLFVSSRLSGRTSLALLAAVALLPVWRKEFSFARVDHNGFIVGALLGMLICLYTSRMGYLRIHRALQDRDAHLSASRERRWLAAAGVFGGVGLWVQANFVFLVILSVWAGFLIHAWFLLARRGHSSTTPTCRYVLRPELWRVWSLSGAATGILFYLIEYFPGHLEMRLEVNHPLYALCWIGLTEALVQFALHEMGARHSPWRGWLGLAFGALLPGLVTFGPPSWFTLRDPVLIRIHTLIREFEPIWTVMPNSRWLWPLLLFGGFPLMLVPAVAVFRSHTHPTHARLRVTVALVASVALLWATWEMNRIAGLAMTALLALAYAVLLSTAGRPAPNSSGDSLSPTRIATLLAACSLAVFALDLRQAWPRLRSGEVGEDVCTRIILRDLAIMAARIVPGPERVVLAGFNESPPLQYFGGFRTTGGLYWENAPGLHATIDFLAAHDDEDARRIAEQRGLRGVLLWATDEKLAQFDFCKQGRNDPSSVRRTLAYRLAHGGPYPDWIGPVPFNRSPLAQGMRFLIFKILPERVARPVTPATADRLGSGPAAIPDVK